MSLQDSWLFPHRTFDVRAFFARIKSPRLADMPDLPAWIDEAARQHDLRAEWLCGLVQKEQSALTKRTLSQHGRDWLCGYGYTEGPVYVQFKGARNQVFSAARGLRRYLTPGDSLYVGNRVGKPWRDLDGNTGTIRNLAEACALQYTPHWSTLTTVERIWREFGFEDGGEAMPTTEDVAKIARDICALYAAGKRGEFFIGKIKFELTDVAYCSEFVRECCEAAAKTADHGPLSARYFGGSAKETEAKLKARGTKIAEASAVPGDVVCFNAGNAGPYGHIGIHLGGGQFAENTSSTGRGPGFVISGYSEIGRGRISGFYHLPEFARTPDTAFPPEITVVALPGFANAVPAKLVDNEYCVTLRDVAKLMGRKLAVQHIKTQKKAYIEEATANAE